MALKLRNKRLNYHENTHNKKEPGNRTQSKNIKANISAKTNSDEQIITQINPRKFSERRVCGKARAQAVDIDDLVGTEAAHTVNMKKKRCLKSEHEFKFKKDSSQQCARITKK